MLQVDPTLTKLTKARKSSLATALLTLALLAAMLFFAGKKFFKPVFPFISADLWWFPALILLFFLAIQLAAAQEGFLRRVEARRQAAFRDDKRFLAAEQPEANSNALKLPVTFKLRLNNLPLIGAFFVLALLVFAIWLLYKWAQQASYFTTESFWIFSCIFILALLFIFLTLYWLFSTEFTQVIEVTAEGLRTHYKGQDSSIHWNDAHLFACYGTFGDAHGRRTRTYELSGSSVVVKWTDYRRKNRIWFIKTGVSFEQYTQLMMALDQIIVARTSLRLHDLM